MNTKKFIAVLCFMISVLTVPAANDSSSTTAFIKGKVVDKKTPKEGLIGVMISVIEAKVGTSSDINGEYTLANLQPGVYSVTFRMDTYREKVVENIKLVAGQTFVLDVVMEDFKEAIDLNDAVVKGERSKEAASTLLVKQKSAAPVSDGISAEAIKRSPASTTSDVMKKISGASIQDNKFAIIRGLNDRYNIGYINGAPLPSTESDRKAFSFDIFPSSMLDNMTIIKTATPDQPADFAGGVIHINTKDFPEKNTYSLSLGSSYNSISTFRTRLTYQGGQYDWAGLDDGTRKLPGALPANPQQYRTASGVQTLGYSRMFNDNWGILQKSALPAGSFQFSSGNKFKFNGNTLGLSTALTYSNTNRYTNVIRRQNIVPDGNILDYEYKDDTYKEEVLWAALVNVSFKLGKFHKFSLKNIYTVNAEDQTSIRRGANGMSQPGSEGEVYNTAFWYTQNKMLSNQVAGEHILPKGIQLKWVGGYNNITRDVPDFRRVSYRRALGSDEPFQVQLGAAPTLEQGGRFFSTLNEKLYSASAEVSMPVYFSSKFKSELKAGASWQNRERAFNSRSFGYVMKSSVYGTYSTYGLDSLFNKENLREDKFYLQELSNYTDSYTGGSSLNAAFIQLDSRIGKRLRAIYGVRMESYNQRLNSLDVSGKPENAIAIDTTINSWLPSINLTYSINAKSNLRAAYSNTVSRPELREIAPFAFYDFNLDAVVAGNPYLSPSRISNYDLRYEIYPSAGEIFSASLFYKNFRNPIEFINEPNSGAGSRRFGYANASEANNYGVELDFRKKLAVLDKLFKTKRFENLTFGANFAYIFSKVDVSSFGNASSTGNGSRALQGQSPYVLNADLQYFIPKTETCISLMVNRVGRRIAYVGNDQFPDIYENPRTVLDMQIALKLLKNKNMDLKINLGDVLARNLVFYQDMDKNGKYNASKDNTVFNYTNGRNVSIGITYRFR